MVRVLAVSALVLAACSSDTTVGATDAVSSTDATSSSSGADGSTASATSGMSMSSTSTATGTQDSSSSEGSADSSTGEPLPCGCLPGEVCVQTASDACNDPPIPNVTCMPPPPSCDGVGFRCDSACGWDVCGGPGCIGVGAEVCGLSSEGIVCGSGGWQCNLFAQTCPRGEKCSSWDASGAGVYGSTRCVPVVDAPVPVGGVCTFEGGRFTGIDDCELGAKCLPENPDDPTGLCRAACLGNPYEASCADAAMTCVLEGDFFGWCLPA